MYQDNLYVSRYCKCINDLGGSLIFMDFVDQLNHGTKYVSKYKF